MARQFKWSASAINRGIEHMRFLYREPEGRVAIVEAAPRATLQRALGELTPEAYREHVITRLCQTTGLDRAGLIELPDDWQRPDLPFRAAWRINAAGGIYVDMDVARALHLTRLRRERAPRLAEQDVIALRALEENKPYDGLAAKQFKQRLRDVTADPRIAAAQTPEELAQLTLDALTA
jgi:hypothetical protein